MDHLPERYGDQTKGRADDELFQDHRRERRERTHRRRAVHYYTVRDQHYHSWCQHTRL